MGGIFEGVEVTEILFDGGKETLTLVVGVASCIGSAPPVGGGFVGAASFGNVFGLLEAGTSGKNSLQLIEHV